MGKKTESDDFDIPEAATYLKISKSSVYKMTSKGEIAFYKRPGGKKIYFRREDLDAWKYQYRHSANFELEAKVLKMGL